MMTVGALVSRAVTGIPLDQLYKMPAASTSHSEVRGALQTSWQVSWPRSHLLPSASRPDGTHTPLGLGLGPAGRAGTEGDAAEPRGASWEEACGARQPGRSLSYCSLCCTHPAEKSQMSAGEAGMTDGSFQPEICTDPGGLEKGEKARRRGRKDHQTQEMARCASSCVQHIKSLLLCTC